MSISYYNMCLRQIKTDKKNGTHICTIESLDKLLVTKKLTVEEYGKLVEELNK